MVQRVPRLHIDLFASRLKFQLEPFISWGPDLEVMEVDAFAENWNRWINVYHFHLTVKSKRQSAS